MSSKGDHLETERKYDADAGFVLPKLGSLPELGGRRATEPRRIYLSATYFDTEDQRLIQHKITLRRRVGGDDEGWHLKLPAGQDTRQELHAPLDEGNTGSAPARLTSRVDRIDTLVTDAAASDETVAEFEAAGLTVIRV